MTGTLTIAKTPAYDAALPHKHLLQRCLSGIGFFPFSDLLQQSNQWGIFLPCLINVKMTRI